jgi:hypothetical protein
MKRQITLVVLTLLLLSSCSKTGNNQETLNKDSVSNSDSSNSGESVKRKVTLTPEELETERREHPEKYLVTDVILDVNSKPHRYNVVLINNSPYKLIRGIVLVSYDVFVGSSRLNTIQSEVEFLDVKSGDTSVVGDHNERGHKSVSTPISHSIISTEFKTKRH